MHYKNNIHTNNTVKNIYITWFIKTKRYELHQNRSVLNSNKDDEEKFQIIASDGDLFLKHWEA